MSQQATASAGPAPTAIEPSRVLVLNDAEQTLVIETIESILARYTSADGTLQKVLAEDEGVPWRSLRLLHSRIAYGEEYDNPVDELTRVTLRKRRLEGEVRRANIRIGQVEEMVVEELQEAGEAGRKHAATGASLSLVRQVWAKVEGDFDALPKDEADRQKALAKARAAEGLAAAGLGDYVRPDFNTNSISAYFRELVNAYDAEQRTLPEHERSPRAVADFLPDELRGLLRLDDTPHIRVRA